MTLACIQSLIGLQGRMNKEEVLGKIRVGSGEMPSFASVIAGKEDAIISFLFDKDSRSVREINFLKEIAKSESANQDADKFKLEAPVRYLDILSNGKFRDSEGRLGIKPPWGTLNAINLNTDEHTWSIPLGNYPNLQEKGGQETGSEGNTGPIVTAGGLVFIGANMGGNNFRFRAYDKDSGKLIWDTSYRVVQHLMPQLIRVLKSNTLRFRLRAMRRIQEDMSWFFRCLIKNIKTLRQLYSPGGG